MNTIQVEDVWLPFPGVYHPPSSHGWGINPDLLCVRLGFTMPKGCSLGPWTMRIFTAYGKCSRQAWFKLVSTKHCFFHFITLWKMPSMIQHLIKHGILADLFTCCCAFCPFCCQPYFATWQLYGFYFLITVYIFGFSLTQLLFIKLFHSGRFIWTWIVRTSNSRR